MPKAPAVVIQYTDSGPRSLRRGSRANRELAADDRQDAGALQGGSLPCTGKRARRALATRERRHARGEPVCSDSKEEPVAAGTPHWAHRRRPRLAQ
eukprot:414108-Pyramimonas_sp.AAC.1